MIQKIKIELRLPPEECIPFLAKNEIVFKNNMTPKLFPEQRFVWTNIENPNNFRFRLKGSDSFSSFWGKCTFKYSKSKWILYVKIYPPIIFLLGLGFMGIMIIYSISQFGMHNYGTIGFYPSIIIPSFFVGLMYLIWSLMARLNARRIKREMIQSFLDQQQNNPYGPQIV